jgi:metal-sulfur cluster biosynthetic enzyme
MHPPRELDHPPDAMDGGAPIEGSAATDVERARRAAAIAALADVVDPELGLGIVELGLVYGVDVDGGAVRVRLTMTSPGCPLGEQIVVDALDRLHDVDGVERADVTLAWEPAWTPARMSAAARALLGWGPR